MFAHCCLIVMLITGALTQEFTSSDGIPRLTHNRTVGNVITGRLEVLVHGIWWPLCGNAYWKDKNAAVVCKQLGYEIEGSLAISVQLPNPPRHVYGGKITCSGYEKDLLHCHHQFGRCYGLHDAGVVCVLSTPECPSAAGPTTTTRMSGSGNATNVTTESASTTLGPITLDPTTEDENFTDTDSLMLDPDSAGIRVFGCEGLDSVPLPEKSNRQTAALGGVIGLLVFILILVSVGWIGTCIVIARRNRQNCKTGAKENEPKPMSVHNRTYCENELGSVSSQEPTYHSLEPTYAVLDDSPSREALRHTYEVIPAEQDAVDGNHLTTAYSKLHVKRGEQGAIEGPHQANGTPQSYSVNQAEQGAVSGNHTTNNGAPTGYSKLHMKAGEQGAVCEQINAAPSGYSKLQVTPGENGAIRGTNKANNTTETDYSKLQHTC